MTLGITLAHTCAAKDSSKQTRNDHNNAPKHSILAPGCIFSHLFILLKLVFPKCPILSIALPALAMKKFAQSRQWTLLHGSAQRSFTSKRPWTASIDVAHQTTTAEMTDAISNRYPMDSQWIADSVHAMNAQYPARGNSNVKYWKLNRWSQQATFVHRIQNLHLLQA